MGKLMTTLLMTFLVLGASSCGTVARKAMCAQIEGYKIKPIRSCNISFQFNRCRCHCLDFSTWDKLPLNSCPEFAGLEGTAHNFELEYCGGIEGFFLSDHAVEIRPKVQALDKIKKDNCF